MKDWKRITVVTFVLIGGTMFFGYWSINQFDIALDNISAAYFENTHSAYPSFKQNMRLASAPPEIPGELATLTDTDLAPDISGAFITLTDSEIAPAPPEIPGELATPTDPEIAPAPPEISEELPTFTDQKLSFTVSQEDTKVYIGCTYPISWQPPTMISSLEAALIDAGSRKAALPERSGLAIENTIEKESQNLNWKVGFVWPGTYYIEVSQINGIDTEFRSKVFEISKMPKGTDQC